MSQVTNQNQKSSARERRRRARITVMVAVLIILLLLTAGVMYTVIRVLQPAGSQVVKSEGGGEGFEWVRSIYGWGPSADQQFKNPGTVAVGPDGAIYTEYVLGDQILVFNPDGSFRRSIGPGSMMAGSPSPLQRPSSVDVDVNGDVYVSDLVAGKVFVFAPEGNLIRAIETGPARTVTVHKDRLYIGLEGTVEIRDKKGEVVSTIGKRGFGKDQFNSPDSIAVAEDGTFYVSDSLNGRIKAYSKDAQLLWVFPSYGAEAKPVTGNLAGSTSRDASGNTEFQLPRGITLDAKGRLLVVDAFEYNVSIVELKKDGATTLESFGKEGATDGSLFYPSDIAFDAERDWVVVADSNNNRLQIFRIRGTGGESGIAAAYRRANLGPVWICAIPFGLLFLLALLLLIFRRRRRESDQVVKDEDELILE